MTHYNHLLTYLLDKGLFAKHQRVLVAVSGGLDSMNLLQFLYDHREALDIALGLAHVNHQQRPESDQEESYLRTWADEHDLPIYVSYFQGIFSEKAARDHRYAFFSQVMQEESYTALTTAHHADDQAETVLMRLIRGSHLRHVAAMREVQPFAGGQLIRPFLTVSKQELPDIFHFEDSSNQSQNFFRNRVRLTYLPTLKKENPNLTDGLRQLAEDSYTAYQAFADLTANMDLTQSVLFQQQSPAVQELALQNYIANFPDLAVSRHQFKEMLGLLRDKKQLTYAIKSGYYLYKDEQQFWIEKPLPSSSVGDDEEKTCQLRYGDRVTYSKYAFHFTDISLTDSSAIPLYSHEPIILRHRRAGDRLYLGGFSKKVRRLFIDDKVPADERKEAIIGEQGGQIIFIISKRKTYLRKASKRDIMIGKLYYESTVKGR